MRKAMLLTLVSASLVIGAAALAQERDAPSPEAPQSAEDAPSPEAPPSAEDAPSAEAQARRAKVVAKVGDVTITLGDVEDAVNEQSPYIRVRYRDPAQIRELVEGMIRFELLARAAERAGAGDEPEVRHVAKQNAVQQLIRRDFDERITPESIPDADVQAYYEAHLAEFSREELRRASHIQVATQAEAARLLTKARETDARGFRELAREHSVDPETRLRGGDLRYFDAEGHPRSASDPQIDEALAAAAFALEETGDISEPIQVGERWSIVKLMGLRAADQRTLAQASPSIRLRLWRERRQNALEELVTRLRREAHVAPAYDSLRLIHLDPPVREGEEEAEAADTHGGAPAEAPTPAN